MAEAEIQKIYTEMLDGDLSSLRLGHLESRVQQLYLKAGGRQRCFWSTEEVVALVGLGTRRTVQRTIQTLVAEGKLKKVSWTIQDKRTQKVKRYRSYTTVIVDPMDDVALRLLNSRLGNGNGKTYCRPDQVGKLKSEQAKLRLPRVQLVTESQIGWMSWGLVDWADPEVWEFWERKLPNAWLPLWKGADVDPGTLLLAGLLVAENRWEEIQEETPGWLPDDMVGWILGYLKSPEAKTGLDKRELLRTTLDLMKSGKELWLYQTAEVYPYPDRQVAARPLKAKPEVGEVPGPDSTGFDGYPLATVENEYFEVEAWEEDDLLTLARNPCAYEGARNV